MSNEQMRVEFEKTYAKRFLDRETMHYLVRNTDGAYSFGEVEQAWVMWQESRATSGAASGDARELVQRMRAQAGRLSIGDVSGRILLDAAMMIEYLAKANPVAPAEQSAPPVPRMGVPTNAELADLMKMAESASVDTLRKGMKLAIDALAWIASREDKQSEAGRCRAQGGITNDCRTDGRCQYAIDHGAEGLGACPTGKCCMPQSASTAPGQAAEQAGMPANFSDDEKFQELFWEHDAASFSNGSTAASQKERDEFFAYVDEKFGALSGEVVRGEARLKHEGWHAIPAGEIASYRDKGYEVRALGVIDPAPAEQSAPPVPLTSIATGYEGGVCVSDSGGLGGSIHLHYESLAEAESAFDVITDAIDEDRRCRVQGGITNDNDSNSLATQSASTAPGQAETCGCIRCLDESGKTTDFLGMQVPVSGTYMVLCATCGNKRCPHANDHRNTCTNSNEPGQPGSAHSAIAALSKEKP